MIVGLTGPNASGKGEAARYIKSKGFHYISLSDILREEAARSGVAPLRENLIKLGNDLRCKNGPGFLAIRAIEGMQRAGDYIVDSIRNPAEVEALRKKSGFILIGIDAPTEIRFKRCKARKRPGDADTLEGFIEKEGKENKISPENQQLKKCLQMADLSIINDSTIDTLHKKIDEAIKENKKT